MPKLGLGSSLPIKSGLYSVIFQSGFWTNFSSTIGKIITGFSSNFSNSLTVNWGDGTTTPLLSGVSVNKTLGTTNVIKLETNNAVVTQINCGTSSPRLGGTVDISAFLNLQEFRCNSNDITALSGYAQNSILTDVQFFDNKVTGTLPSLSGLTNLQEFRCDTNQLTGSIPSLSGLTNLQIFRCYTNQLTSFAGGSVSNTLGQFEAENNQLNQSSINAILSALVAAGRTSANGACILNLGGGFNASPTGQGITDKATLISRGWTITTN